MYDWCRVVMSPIKSAFFFQDKCNFDIRLYSLYGWKDHSNILLYHLEINFTWPIKSAWIFVMNTIVMLDYTVYMVGKAVVTFLTDNFETNIHRLSKKCCEGSWQKCWSCWRKNFFLKNWKFLFLVINWIRVVCDPSNQYNFLNLQNLEACIKYIHACTCTSFTHTHFHSYWLSSFCFLPEFPFKTFLPKVYWM